MSEGFSIFEGPIASGRTADVYSAGTHEVIKLFRTWVPESDVASERHKASIARAMGIPTPAVGQILRYRDRIGLTFERVEGPSMLDCLHTGSLQPLARWLAELHLDLHSREASEELPAQRNLLIDKVSCCPSLSRAERQAVLGILAQLPDDSRVCHGDFHPGNVMLTDRGPLIIDWVDASRGNPIADVARTSLLFLGHIEHELARESEKVPVRACHRTYLEHYMERVPGRSSEYRLWITVMAAARLSEGITEQHDWLQRQVRTGLAQR